MEIDKEFTEEVFHRRIKRKIGDIELYLSVMPQDVPDVRVLREQGRITVEFLFAGFSIHRPSREKLKAGFYLQETPDYPRYIHSVILAGDNINLEEFRDFVEGKRQEIVQELAGINWKGSEEGRKVAELDMKERQLSFLLHPDVFKVLGFLNSKGVAYETHYF